MSWILKVKNDFIIKTGDSREYKVLWRNASRVQEYNVAEFEFPEIDGTLVRRSRPKGMRYNIEFYFQGENHLDDAEAFRISADDDRPWTLSHPFYGTLIVHPLSLNYDNTVLNVTKVTGTIVETITDDRPKTTVDPVDKISADKTALDDTFANSFATNVQPDTTDVSQMSANNASVYSIGKKKVKLDIDAEEYFNLFNDANSKIIEATSDPLAAMRTMQSVLNKPALFGDSVTNRLTVLQDQFEALRISIEGITEPSKKRIYESNNAAIVSAMLLAASTPQDGDYGNGSQVLAVVDQLIDIYNTFIDDVDSLQTENGGDLDSYIPDADSMIGLADLFDFTISNLFNIALNSKQERTFILESDSNAILLAHRVYGLQADDSTVDDFINQNEFGLIDILQIRKGTVIKYYV